MRGNLREKRPGCWELRNRLGRNPLTGQQRQVSRAVRGSRREAEKALAAFYAEVDAPASPTSKGTSPPRRPPQLTGAAAPPATLQVSAIHGQSRELTQLTLGHRVSVTSGQLRDVGVAPGALGGGRQPATSGT